MPKIRPNQTKIKLKLDNKKVKLADKKRVKTKEEPKKNSLVVKFAKPVKKPSPIPPVLPEQNPLINPGPVQDSEEMSILRSLHAYNNRKSFLFFGNLLFSERFHYKKTFLIEDSNF